MTVGAEDFAAYGEGGTLLDDSISRTAAAAAPVNSVNPLCGMWFQQYWERRCFEVGGGSYSAPAQRVVDFVERKFDPTEPLPDHLFMGTLEHGDLHACLPAFVNTALVNALKALSRKVCDPFQRYALIRLAMSPAL